MVSVGRSGQQQADRLGGNHFAELWGTGAAPGGRGQVLSGPERETPWRRWCVCGFNHSSRHGTHWPPARVSKLGRDRVSKAVLQGEEQEGAAAGAP